MNVPPDRVAKILALPDAHAWTGEVPGVAGRPVAARHRGVHRSHPAPGGGDAGRDRSRGTGGTHAGHGVGMRQRSLGGPGARAPRGLRGEDLRRDRLSARCHGNVGEGRRGATGSGGWCRRARHGDEPGRGQGGALGPGGEGHRGGDRGGGEGAGEGDPGDRTAVTGRCGAGVTGRDGYRCRVREDVVGISRRRRGAGTGGASHAPHRGRATRREGVGRGAQR